jgi:hypothetical protein
VEGLCYSTLRALLKAYPSRGPISGSGAQASGSGPRSCPQLPSAPPVVEDTLGLVGEEPDSPSLALVVSCIQDVLV